MEKRLVFKCVTLFLYLGAGVLMGGVHWLLKPDPWIPWSILTGVVGFLVIVFIHIARTWLNRWRDLSQIIDGFRKNHQSILAKINHIESQLSLDTDSAIHQDLKAEIQIMTVLMEKLSRYYDENKENTAFQALKNPDGPVSVIPDDGQKMGNFGEPTRNILLELKKALEQDRIQTLLQPIVSLPQRKPRHFECFSRLRTDDNHLILADDFLKIGAGQSLIRLIDNTLLFKCASLTRRLLKKKFNVLFFCNISHETLMDQEFLDGFIDFINGNKPLIPHFVFELDDQNLIIHGDKIFPILDKLAGYGCFFSLDLTSFDGLNIPQLARHQFKFIKMPAKIVMEALKNPKKSFDIYDVKSRADQNAIDIILTRIEDEKTLIQCQDLQFDFGQGYLFGEPRLMVI